MRARTGRRVLPYATAGLALVGAGLAAQAYLLARFPFDGLYGQDSYAYYWQAVEIWNGLTGRPAPAWPFAGQGLYHWPVGYHLQIIAGFLLGPGAAGGRAITRGLAALAPALTGALGLVLWRGGSSGARLAAGLAAGGVLLSAGIYERLGLALMADVPSVAWLVAGALCWALALRAPAGAGAAGRRAVAAGLAIGLAILTRYNAALILAPLLVYTVAVGRQASAGRGALARLLALAAGGCALPLLAQAGYLLTHPAAHVDTGALGDWSAANFLANTVRTSDGVATFAHPPAVFYLIDPLRDTAVGFLSPLYLPALALGVVTLWRRERPAAWLLLTWWAVWGLFLSGIPYEAHRFVIAFLPPLAVAIGVGVGAAVERLRGLARRGGPARGESGTAPAVAGALAALVLLAAVAGAVQSGRGAQGQAAEQARIKEGELGVVRAAQAAVAGQPGPPGVVAFGLSAALYHYTGWPVLDFFNNDTPVIGRALAGAGPRLVILPEASMATQWRGTPSAARWDWIRAHYRLTPAGSSGGYAVYRVEGPR
jgi:4-amino-4-deoxy-L-arabinose transferase-like glycosyltransferase